MKRWIDAPGNLTRLGQRADRRKTRKRIQRRGCGLNQLTVNEQWRLTNGELSRSHTIESPREQRVGFVESVVENPASAANHSLRRMRTITGRRRPGKRQSRRKVRRAVSICLILVSQSITEGSIWTNLPLVLSIDTAIDLRNGRQRISRLDAELRSAAAKRANLRRRHSHSLKQERSAI